MTNPNKSEPNLDDIQKQLEELSVWKNSLIHAFNAISKQIDDIKWHYEIDDIADWKKVRFTSSPPSEFSYNVIKELLGYKAEPEDKVVIYAYTFYPKKLDKDKKYPLMVVPHGGIHSNFGTSSSDLVRDLIKQGYIIVAPEYRGSTGYGKIFYHLIDYGGLEINDTYTSRNWILENCEQVDPKRIGIMGYSHGGFHTLLNIFRYPKAYTAAYAGVPVSDILYRQAYRWRASKEEMAKSYGGKTPWEDIDEYRRRSPVWNAEKLEIPLLIHTNTNDRDVPCIEVENLILHLKAIGKEFEYKIYKDAPGGHGFERLDTLLAKEARLEAYKFLAKYLKPENPPK